MAAKKKKFHVTWTETHSKSIEVMAVSASDAERMISHGDYKESEANDDGSDMPEDISAEELSDDED